MKIEDELFKLEKSWQKILKDELEKDYIKKLHKFLKTEIKNKKDIYPSQNNIFQAFTHTPFNKVKVVILGQDPYHGVSQAHGLSFSVLPGAKFPPSLRNIFKELEADLGLKVPESGHLVSWAKEGVLLLNSVLTVEGGHAGSHQKKGWEEFTDKVIEVLNAKKENLVFILWGAPAQKKGSKIDQTKHLILKSPHPSPLSSFRGFFGSRPFSQANAYLEKHGIKKIDWNLD